ncbi:MAG: cellulase family glycosylhydrolase [Treponema sp.]|jgi:hypothetical protein|nr:cellulase family glycosylhydrolase [Treponema sp.]
MLIRQNRIIDERGRTLILRGLNLGGDSKVPLPPAPVSGPGRASSQVPWGLLARSLDNPSEASFAGRPFPLEEADERLAQLVRWGFIFVRLPVTWEALEHQGPGQYDESYLAYLRKLLLAMEKHGISAYIDPHQDVWSRFTGGDGAPAWTLEGLGMRPELMDATGAAFTWQRYGEYHGGRPCPPMSWPANYNRYAGATMFSLFFAGNYYAPDLRVGGESVQDWLQGHYIAAMRHAYRRLKNCAAIAGWGTMNEPNAGFVGHRDLASPEKPLIPLGPAPSPFQAMLAASGHRVEVPVYGITPLGRRVIRRETLNPQGLSLFRPGFSCPWMRAGLWEERGGEGRLLRKDHFALYRGRPPRFEDDFLKPFMLKFIESMKGAREGTVFFIEGPANGGHPAWGGEDPPNTVNAFHWYDGFSLYTRSFRPWFGFRPDGRPVLGRRGMAAYYRDSLGRALAWTGERMGDMPCLLGEFGIPFDMNGGRAYKTGDYSAQEEALSFYYDAIDEAGLHSTIWNYSAGHSKEWGDGWNGEDNSIVSRGPGGEALGRALAGWLRPYPMATAGIPLGCRWDRKKGSFRFRYRAEAALKAPTEIFAPAECLGEKPEYRCEAGGNSLQIEYAPSRLLIYHGDYDGEVKLELRRAGVRQQGS